MKKRLRKKLAEGEFTGYAFGVSYVLDDIPGQRANEFLDRFVEQAIEANGLECRVGHHDQQWDFHVACVAFVKPSAAQRDAVVAWLEGRKELARFEVESLESGASRTTDREA